MKRNSLFIILIIINGVINAQFYVQPYLGYMFSTHPMKVQSVEIINSVKSVYVSTYKMGEGLNTGIICGYRMNDHLSIELNTCTHVFASYSNSVEQGDLSRLNSFYYSGYFGEDNYHNNIFQIAPQLAYNITINKLSVNLKMGPNFLKSKITHNLHYIDWELDDWKFYPLNTIQDMEYYSKFTVGLRSSVGIDYHVSSNVSACLSFVSVLNNSKFTHGEIKRYEIDGVSYMYKLPDTSIELEEGDSKINFSQVGFVMGITYIFRKKN